MHEQNIEEFQPKFIESRIATDKDLKILGLELKSEIDGLKFEINQFDKKLNRFESRMDRLESKMDNNFIWTIGLIITSIILPIIMHIFKLV